MPTPIKSTNTPTLKAVITTCSRLPARVLRPCTRVSASTTTTESQVGCSPGHTRRVYSPKASAASAVGAAKPTVADTQPERNPNAG